MALHFCDDTSPANWIVNANIPTAELLGFGPAGFAAYGRLRYIPDPVGPNQQEADVDIADGHPSSIDQARRALDILGGFTTTPDDCYFCVWDGRSDVRFPSTVNDRPSVDIPDRHYVLLHGSLSDLASWETALGGEGYPPPPSFAWPADRHWCFASDVDPHWAGIGSTREAIQALMDDRCLDVVPAQPTASQPTYY